MYNQIQANQQRSFILIAIFIGVLAAVGYLYGELSGTGYSGLAFALALSVGMTLVSWFAGDKIVLTASGAKEIRSREEQPYIWNLVENLCITAGLPMPRVYIIPDEAMNAFATGRDPQHASIAFTSGIISALENEELEGVTAHELSHIKNQDIKIMMLAAVLVGSLSILGNSFFHGGFGSRRRNENGSGNAIFLVAGIVLLILSPLIGQLIQLAISRRREYLADASGALLTRYPEGLARALEKIATQSVPVTRVSTATAHLWISNPLGEGSSFKNSLRSLFSTHPPIADRVKKLHEMTDAR
ncbi:M48 family metalloprotease [Patescibacteria group bacterium]|nr:M48 family metalloprotease [Patescibacteria group bacterium]